MQRDKIIDSLNARAPSPWDKFSASPSPHSEGLEIEMRRSEGIPRLAPEVEQGNVEYKLILMNPTPERLHRLVTQLNWRLMEGNGEAYYQLGVADSGELVGLTKREMEATLETLENMAGELGASVIISREIEVRGHLAISLALDSINGMGGKDMNGMISSSSASSLLSSSVASEGVTTDAETSEAEGESENADDTTSSPIGGVKGAISMTGEGDPDEIIVRSAPVPITPSFLRRQRPHGVTAKVKERTLRPQDFSSNSIEAGTFQTPNDEDDEDNDSPGVFAFTEFQDSMNMPSSSLDPTLPPRTKTFKAPKPSKLRKIPNQPKGAKPPIISIPVKTPEQVAQKLAERRAKRDKRREERKRALLDPIYDHGDLITQDGGSGGINYESIVHEYDDVEQSTDGMTGEWNGEIVSPSNTLMSSLVTLTPADAAAPVSVRVDPAPMRADSQSGDNAVLEPRLIVEALVVRKAGFGRGFVDLSQFDEELAHLPSFSLS